jgi:hypothetical protein
MSILVPQSIQFGLWEMSPIGLTWPQLHWWREGHLRKLALVMNLPNQITGIDIYHVSSLESWTLHIWGSWFFCYSTKATEPFDPEWAHLVHLNWELSRAQCPFYPLIPATMLTFMLWSFCVLYLSIPRVPFCILVPWFIISRFFFGVFRVSHNDCPPDGSFGLCIQPDILWALYCTNHNWSPYFVDINRVLFHCGLQFLTELYLLLCSPNHQLDK